MPPLTHPRIGILVVAYNAASTLAAVLDRIPPDFRSRVTEVIVSDDSSTDSTYLVGLGYKQIAPDLPLTVLRNPENLGYGGNQKVGYRLAIEHDLDIVVLLHGDGQYAPELLPDMVAPLEDGACDAVFGSRMMEPKAARKGGMPLYKYLGNRVLTRIENALLDTSLSEFHSGYRAYRVEALRRLNFSSYSDDFDFDTEIIIDMVDQRMGIHEIPIPTYYGDEICYVNGVRYARQVVGDVLRYRATRSALGAALLGGKSGASDSESVTSAEVDHYTFKPDSGSSHGRLLARVGRPRPLDILDLGCGAGYLAAKLRELGHRVTGIDVREAQGVTSRTDHFLVADLARGLPEEIVGPFDVIILGDVLEHVRHPEILLQSLHRVWAPGGRVLVTVPNISHWYPRLRIAFGMFGYDKTGILDEDHVRFFTRRLARQLFARTGWTVTKTEGIGTPLESLVRGDGVVLRALRTAESLGLVLRQTLFAYQILFELVPARPSPSVTSDRPVTIAAAAAGQRHGTSTRAITRVI